MKKPFLKGIFKTHFKKGRENCSKFWIELNFNIFISWAKLWQKLSMKLYTWVYLTVSSIWRCRILNTCFDFYHFACMQKTTYNIYSIFKIWHVQIEELPRTFNINLGKKCTPYFTFHIFRYTHVYNFIHNFCQSVAQAIKKDWYDIPYFLKYCPTTLLWYLY